MEPRGVEMQSRPMLPARLLRLLPSQYACSVVAKGIPVFRPGFGQEELEAVEAVFKSGWLGPGPRVEEFEGAFAESVGALYAVTVNSCTAALHLTLLGLGLGPGDEVLVPSLSFASSAHAPAYCGCRVRFVDVDIETRTLSPEDLEAKITPASRAVIPVHYGGHPCQMEEIWEISERHGLKVVEDAAHACGASYRGRLVGGLDRTTATCFSFNALKNLSTGDGGMVTTNSAELAETVRRLRWMGINKNTFERTSVASDGEAGDVDGDEPLPRYEWYYEMRELGYKYVMNDITAAIGLVQLARLPEMQARRAQMVRRYREGLKNLNWLTLPVEKDFAESAWHLFAVATLERDALRKSLQEAGIATSVHYYPLHLQPYYRSQGKLSLPVTERLARELLSLPFHPNLTIAEIDAVIEAVREYGAVLARASNG